MRKPMLLRAVAVLAVGLCLSASGCANGRAKSSDRHDWSMVVEADATLTKTPMALVFHVAGSAVAVNAWFSVTDSQGPVFRYRLQSADADGNAVGRPTRLRNYTPAVESLPVFYYRTATRLQPGDYRLTYWGSGYCTVVVFTR